MKHPKPTSIPPAPSEEEIAICAYLIWEQEGRPEGRDKVHWEQAEEQLIASYAHERWAHTPRRRKSLSADIPDSSKQKLNMRIVHNHPVSAAR